VGDEKMWTEGHLAHLFAPRLCIGRLLTVACTYSSLRMDLKIQNEIDILSIGSVGKILLFRYDRGSEKGEEIAG
jgi:hypothetical protein